MLFYSFQIASALLSVNSTAPVCGEEEEEIEHEEEPATKCASTQTDDIRMENKGIQAKITYLVCPTKTIGG